MFLRRDLLLSLILSAILFSFSFVFVDCCAWMILFFVFPLGYFYAQRLQEKGMISFMEGDAFVKGYAFFWDGFLWGVVAYGIYFIWLYGLLATKSNATMFFSLLLYCFVVTYFSLLSGAWFLLSGFVMYCLLRVDLIRKNCFLATRKVIFYLCVGFITLLGAGVHFFFVCNYSGRFFGVTGFPFLNPIIPLMKYKKFILVLNVVVSFFCGPVAEVPAFFHMPKQEKVLWGRRGEALFLYLATVNSDSVQSSSVDCALEILGNIEKLACYFQDAAAEKVFVVGPETTYPYPFNKNQEYLELWSKALPEDVELMFGSLRQQPLPLGESVPEKMYQTVFRTRGRLIIDVYDKGHVVPFVERVPKKWVRVPFARSIFLGEQSEISCGSEQKAFSGGDFLMWPRICSEFFFCVGQKGHSVDDLTVLFVNDSWFYPYFKKILVLTARLNSILRRESVLYIGHREK